LIVSRDKEERSKARMIMCEKNACTYSTGSSILARIMVTGYESCFTILSSEVGRTDTREGSLTRVEAGSSILTGTMMQTVVQVCLRDQDEVIIKRQENG
jgi:hypothetical protein